MHQIQRNVYKRLRAQTASTSTIGTYNYKNLLKQMYNDLLSFPVSTKYIDEWIQKKLQEVKEKRLKAKKIEALEETEQSTEEGEEEQEIVFEEIIVDTGKEGEKLKELDDDGFEELERNYVNKWIQKKLQEAKGKGLKAKKTEMLEKIEQPTVEEQEQSIEEREEDQEIEFEEITVDTGEEEEELKQLDDELLKQLENKLKFDD